MTIQDKMNILLEGIVESAKDVIPFELQLGSAEVVVDPIIPQAMGVIIGVTGNLKGRILITSTDSVFGAIGSKMFDMEVTEGELLESAIAELGNVMSGHISTYAGKHQIFIDITPPTVIVGSTKIYSFSSALRVPLEVEQFGTLEVVLMIKKD